MFWRCFGLTCFLVMLATSFVAHCPAPPRRSPPASPQELLDCFDRTLAGMEATHAGVPFDQWPEHRRELWRALQAGREDLILTHNLDQ